MQIKSIKLLPVHLTFKQPFVSAHETLTTRDLVIVEVLDEYGNQGLGELDAFVNPYYNAETLTTASWIIKQILAPKIKDLEFQKPQEISNCWQAVRSNNLAKAALETAIWAAFAQRQHQPLRQVLAQAAGVNSRMHIRTGISLGINNLAQTQAAMSQALELGYQKIKLKVHGNNDLPKIAQLRQQFPQAPLMIDANGSLQNTDTLAATIDDLNLLMIEDPFAPSDLKAAQKLQNQMQTPICFDEPITGVAAALNALAFDQCRIISCKIGALGGFGPLIQLIKAQQKFHFPLWCGAMLEGGIGRALNLAAASLETFAFVSDIGETRKYYQKDLTLETFQLHHGCFQLPTTSGLGVSLLSQYQAQLAQTPSLI